MSVGLGFPRLGQRPKSFSTSRLTAAQVRVLDLSQSAASPGAAVRVLALGDAFEPEQATMCSVDRPCASGAYCPFLRHLDEPTSRARDRRIETHPGAELAAVIAS